MSTAVHRNTDSRVCGATTIVQGQSNVYVNNLLASVQGDPNSHSGGALSASVNDGTVFINNRKVVLKGSSAAPDLACAPVGPPHCNPVSVGASTNVFACGGSGGGGAGTFTGSPDETVVDPTGSNLYPDPAVTKAGDDTPLPRPIVDPDGESSYDPSGFSEADQARIAELENDPSWNAKLTEMEAKYPGLDRNQLYQIVNGESNFDPQARNPSGATGLFQIMPASANDIGHSTDQISRMTATQQLGVYDDYLDYWNYSGDNHLGMMQAAPAYASRTAGSIVYPVGTAAHRQNPPWRPSSGGHITVQSINDYYDRN